MPSLLLWTHSETWRAHIVQAMTEQGHQVLVCEQADQLAQAILADAYQGLIVDHAMWLASPANSLGDMLSDAGFQGKVISLGEQPLSLRLQTESDPRQGASISEIVHMDPEPSAQQLQALTAYWSQQPRSRWAGLTFDSLPGFQEIQARYKAKLPAQLQALQQSFDDKAWVDLQKRAHAIKGGAGSFGLERLTELAAQLDKAARACDEAQAAQYLALIQSEFGGAS